MNTEDKAGANVDLVDGNFQVLNERFAGSGFQFELVSTVEFIDNEWVCDHQSINAHTLLAY